MNKKMSGTIAALVIGQSLLTSVRKIAGGKFEIELVEAVQKPNTEINVPAALNEDDERFSPSLSKRRAWQGCSPKMLKDLLGIKVDDIADGEKLEVNILNPTLKNSGTQLRLKVVEALAPIQESDKDFPEKRIKKAPSKEDADVLDYLKKEGQFIWTRNFIVGGEPKHTFIQHDERVSSLEEVALEEVAEKTIALVGEA